MHVTIIKTVYIGPIEITFIVMEGMHILRHVSEVSRSYITDNKSFSNYGIYQSYITSIIRESGILYHNII